MKEDVEKLSPFAIFVLLLVAGSFIAYGFAIVNTIDENERRQQEIDTFYQKHNCKPFGYVATKYDPVRTYVCDNGVFIARDMK